MPKLNAIQLSNAAKLCRPAPFLVTNRVRYHDDDPVIHVVGTLATSAPAPTWSLMLNALDPPGPDVPLLTQAAVGPLPPEFELLLESSVIGEAGPIPFGKFRLRVDGIGAPLLSNEFDRVSGFRHGGLSLPASGIPLIVEQAPDDGPWPITTGVPLPLGAITDPSKLAVFNEVGVRVPAQITAIAEWYPPLGNKRSVKWVSVDFVANCLRNRTTRYTIRSGASPQPAVSWISDGANSISVDTGPIRFVVKKRGFNGIDLLERWTGTGWRTIAQAGIGPYLEVRANGDTARTAVNRIRFTAADDPTVNVGVIKRGDVSVTIRAEGDYYHPDVGSQWEGPGGTIATDDERRHCHFVIDITAYRGSSQIKIASTLIITYDPGNVREDLSTAIPDSFFSSPQERRDRLGAAYVARLGHWWKQPIDIGWDWGLSSSFGRGYLGYQTAESATVWNAEPWTGARITLHQFRSDRCAVVVDAFDGLRYAVYRVAAGVRSEGWATADLGPDALTVALRDTWQRFPKEIGVRRDEREVPHLTVHTWPRHGYGQEDRFHGSENLVRRNVSVVPDEVDETLLRTQIWKLPFAHEGDAMDLRAPTDVVKRWIELNRAGYDKDWDLGSISAAVSRTAQGIGTTTEMALFVHDGSVARDPRAVQAEGRRFAAFWQSGTHALPDPQWTGDSRAEGRFDGPNPSHSVIEEGIVRAIDGWRVGLGGVEGGYGMWIYGSLHNNWLTNVTANRAGVDELVGVPQLHRLWQASHYRNVWMAWLLYLRSGDRRAREWALATSRLYADVGTIHREPMRPATGRFAGDLAHVDAITPWGTGYERSGHWIDPDAHRLRFLLAGDLYARRLYDVWWQTFSRDLPIGAGFGRETTNTLGSIADYYAFTQDPSALVLLRTLGAATFGTLRRAGATSYPFYDLSGSRNPGDHAVWNRRWLEQYYDLTGDVDAVRFAVDFVEQTDALPTVAAFAYLELESSGPISPTGTPIASYLDRHLPFLWDAAARVLNTDGGPYHGHGEHITAVSSYWLQEWPYFLRALRHAAIQSPGQPGRPGPFEPPGTVATAPTAPSYQRIAYPWRHRATGVTPVNAHDDWRNATVTVYALSDRDFEVSLLVQGGMGVNSVTGSLSVYRYDPQATAGPWVSAAPPGQSGYAVSFDTSTPQVVAIQHVGPLALYQIQLLPSGNAAPLKAPLTSCPEVFELRGPGIGPQTSPPPSPWSDRIAIWLHREATVQTFLRQLWYLAGAFDTPQPMTIVAAADSRVFGLPSAVHVEDSRGVPVAPRQVIPAAPPFGPYEYNGPLGPAATAGQPIRSAGGMYQLASYLNDDSRAQVAFVINTRRGRSVRPARFFSAGIYGPALRLEGNGTRAFIALNEQHLEEVILFIDNQNVNMFST